MAAGTLSFEQLWALFQEVAREQREAALRSQELDTHLKELSEREERRSKELNQVIDRLEKNLGGLGSSLGELIETLIASRLWEKFVGYPYNLQRACRRIPIYNAENKVITDIYILLVDSEWVMAVEVKREPDKDDIDHHIRRMRRILKYPPAEVKGRSSLEQWLAAQLILIFVFMHIRPAFLF